MRMIPGRMPTYGVSHSYILCRFPRVLMVLHNAGSRWVHVFRSPAEFRLHLKWILEGQPMKPTRKPNCRCCYCDPSRTQGEISKELGMIHPNPDRKPGGRGGRGKGGGPGGKQRSTTNSGAITFKDYTKLNSGASS